MAARGTGQAQPGNILLVIHDFTARNPDELSLAKGDRIELIERDDEFGDGWFLGRHMTNGNTGLFPEVYTTPAPRGTLLGAPRQRPVRAVPPDLKLVESAHGPQARTPSSAQASPLARTLPSPASTMSSPRIMGFAADSPVMNETLSVIDEHMTDMHLPTPPPNKRDTVGSIYSHRFSYIPGHETDEDELHSEEEVLSWSPERVAEYLSENGVERAHCDVFLEQEISGEVLLAMEQSSVFLKEFDLGSVGRRLKTWYRIKALQDEVRRMRPDTSSTTEPDSANPRRSTFRGLDLPARNSNAGFDSPTAAVLPSPNHSSMRSPQSGINSRPSAQRIRTMQHNRRHSSMDSTVSVGAEPPRHKKQVSLDQQWQAGQAMSSALSGQITNSSTSEPDRAYFSSNEADKRSSGRTITKTSSTDSRPRARTTNERGAEVGASAQLLQSMFNSVSTMQSRLSKRSVTSPVNSEKPMMEMKSAVSPVVTKLEPRQDMRAVSDAVTSREKQTVDGTSSISVSESASTENKSIERPPSDGNSQKSMGPVSRTTLLPPARRSRNKTKKHTSAYTRGLENKTPTEQMQDCDYSGWMKKRSGSLMSTWKSRLFVLKGRRLSYYYSAEDKAEKGLIDISFHRVLPAQGEMLTGLSAAVSGGSNPASPRDDADGLFIFKLVPPKPGTRGVVFTKPTTHYFAVNSKQEGREWMAALMKATIERDEASTVTTSYNQKTISLAAARAKRERPPAFKDDTDTEESPAVEKESPIVDQTIGLGIGLDGGVSNTASIKSVSMGDSALGSDAISGAKAESEAPVQLEEQPEQFVIEAVEPTKLGETEGDDMEAAQKELEADKAIAAHIGEKADIPAPAVVPAHETLTTDQGR
ncbi:hypothetical protein K470DRAFT_237189 [Piedraia hortae CBS 480.64]|uniref:PH-domain-containing protein n=1 Tax=Piedraia hortae CBS 480.64 TaxID=1314780 RepID=A0A6A7BTR7_9PEZI|nr:hypothetical protein K470DRAFT_237189 [Piedraia hortae CBS 480.64]